MDEHTTRVDGSAEIAERALELAGRDVAEAAVEALSVVPCPPSKRRELEVLDRLPEWAGWPTSPALS